MSLLERAISPAQAVEKLADKGVHISERALRRRADNQRLFVLKDAIAAICRKRKLLNSCNICTGWG